MTEEVYSCPVKGCYWSVTIDAWKSSNYKRETQAWREFNIHHDYIEESLKEHIDSHPIFKLKLIGAQLVKRKVRRK